MVFVSCAILRQMFVWILFLVEIAMNHVRCLCISKNVQSEIILNISLSRVRYKRFVTWVCYLVYAHECRAVPEKKTQTLTSFQWFADTCESRWRDEKKLNKKEQTQSAVASNPIIMNVRAYVCNWISIRAHASNVRLWKRNKTKISPRANSNFKLCLTERRNTILKHVCRAGNGIHSATFRFKERAEQDVIKRPKALHAL